MKHLVLTAIAAFTALSSFAQTENLRIELTDGTVKTFAVESIRQMTFGEEESPANPIAGTYSGINTVVVGGQFTYTTDVDVTITANEDGTIDFTWPEYSLTGTVMGDLTLSALTIPSIPFDEAKGGYYLDFSTLGLKQHFTAKQNGNTSMDNDYTLGEGSTILIEEDADGIKVTNPFKLGAMPFPIIATFVGKK